MTHIHAKEITHIRSHSVNSTKEKNSSNLLAAVVASIVLLIYSSSFYSMLPLLYHVVTPFILETDCFQTFELKKCLYGVSTVHLFHLSPLRNISYYKTTNT